MLLRKVGSRKSVPGLIILSFTHALPAGQAPAGATTTTKTLAFIMDMKEHAVDVLKRRRTELMN